MKLYGTQYTPPGGHLYVSAVWAKSKSHAEELCRWRGIGEELAEWCQEPHPRASTLFLRALDRRVKKKPDKMEVIHALAWLGYLGLMSKRLSPHDILGDNGVLHEAAHWMMGIYDHDKDVGNLGWRRIADSIRRVEEMVPGYLPQRRQRR